MTQTEQRPPIADDDALKMARKIYAIFCGPRLQDMTASIVESIEAVQKRKAVAALREYEFHDYADAVERGDTAQLTA